MDDTTYVDDGFTVIDDVALATESTQAPEQIITLNDFIGQFGDGLLAAVQAQNPPIYQGQRPPVWDDVLDGSLIFLCFSFGNLCDLTEWIKVKCH